MEKMKNCIVALLVSLSSIWLNGCGDKNDDRLNEKLNENALLVKKAFEYLNEENLNGLFPIVSDSITDYQAIKKTLGGHIYASDIEIRVESSAPDRVYFTCLIPGATSVVVYNLLDRKFSLKVSEAMSMNISWRGSVNILTDRKTGEKKIDISDKKNPFSFYLNIVYNGLLESPLKVSDLTTNDKYVDAINLLIWIVGSTYTPIFNDQNYISNVVVPDINRVLGDEKMLENIITSGATEELSGAKKNEEIKITIEKNTDVAPEKNAPLPEKNDTMHQKNNLSPEQVSPLSPLDGTYLFKVTGRIFLKFWWVILIGFLGLTWYIYKLSRSMREVLGFYMNFLLPLAFFWLLVGVMYFMVIGFIVDGVKFFNSTNINPKISSTGFALLVIIVGVIFSLGSFFLLVNVLYVWLGSISPLFASWGYKNNINEALKAVEKITNEKKLYRITKDAADINVQIAAIKKITDKKILHETALKDRGSKEAKVRIEAILKITDEEVLKTVVLKDGNSDVREQAIIRITDEATLKEVALNCSDYTVCKKAIEKITYREFINALALKALNGDVRKDAVSKITDREFTKELALKASNGDVRKDAVSKITDTEVLKQVALHERYWKTRLEAVEKITDAEVLKEVAWKDAVIQVQKAAAERITDQKILLEIFKTHKDSTVREAAFERITDQETLADVAKNDETSLHREAAVERITDQRILFEIYKTANDSKVRFAAVDRITDQRILVEIYKTDDDYKIRIAAVEKINNQSILVEIYKTDDETLVRIAAVKRINDQRILVEIYKTENKTGVRIAAVERITDQDILRDIAINNSDIGIKLAAYQRLNNCNNEILQTVEGVFYSRLKKREENARRLCHLMKNNWFEAKVFWEQIREHVSKKHIDKLPHSDQLCSLGHSDSYGYHTDTGSTITFPPYPFND